MWKIQTLHLGFALFVFSSVCLNTCRGKRKEPPKGKSRSLIHSNSNWESKYPKPSSRISKSINHNHTQTAKERPHENEDSTSFPFLVTGVNVEYFKNTASFLKKIIYNYPKNSQEPYFLNKKSEDSCTLSFFPAKSSQDFSYSSDAGEEIEDDFQSLKNRLKKKFSYWTEFIFDGYCVSSGGKDFQNVSETSLFKIVSSLMSVEKTEVSLNNYSCEETMKINASLARATYEQHEQHLYDSLGTFAFHFCQRRFVFVHFTSSKFTILERKLSQPRRRNVFYFFAYGYSLLAVVFLLLSAVLYSCQNYVVRKKRRVYLVSRQVVHAYDKADKPTAKDLTFPNIYKTYPEQPPTETEDEDSFLTLDFDAASEVHEEPYKIREKSHSVQGLENFQEKDSNRGSRRESSTLSECFMKLGDVEFLDYFRGLHYYYGNLEYDFDRSNEADFDTATNEEGSESTAPLQASSESLGVTRVEYVDSDEHTFKFETDL